MCPKKLYVLRSELAFVTMKTKEREDNNNKGAITTVTNSLDSVPHYKKNVFK